MKISFYMHAICEYCKVASPMHNALPVARKIDIDECTMHVFVPSWHRFDDKDVIVSQFYLLIKLSQVITTSLLLTQNHENHEIHLIADSIPDTFKVCLTLGKSMKLMNWPDTDLLMESSSRSLDTLRDMTILTSLLCCFDLTKCFPLTSDCSVSMTRLKWVFMSLYLK